MKFILVSGGSGGHIYPCLSLANYLKERGEEVLLVGVKGGMEEDIYLKSDLDSRFFEIDKKKVKSFLNNYKSISSLYMEYKPDALILFGNYISFSFALVAKKMKIPIYLHEQNVIYGKANKLIGLFAKRIYLSLPIKKDLYKNKSLLVGNPKGEDNKIQDVYLNKSKKNVFIVMGSLGSETINDIVKKMINISDKNINYHIVIGKKHYKKFTSNIDKKENVFIYEYIDNLISYTSKCDLLISRSGATTISEIINYKIPSILIPSPYVSNNHQYKNALYLKENKACHILSEKDLNERILVNEISEMVNDENRLKGFKNNLEKLEVKNTKRLIYEDILTYEKRIDR